MAGTILLIILFILCILFLLPISIKGAYGDGKWFVEVRYTFFKLFRKESVPPKPKPAPPPKPEDVSFYDPEHPETAVPAGSLHTAEKPLEAAPAQQVTETIN